MPASAWATAGLIWLALAIGFALVSIAGTLVDRHIRNRKAMEFRRYIKSREWQ